MAGSSHPLVQTDLPASVTLDAGTAGLPRLCVSSAAAQAQVYLHGAHVTSWTPSGQAPVLWLSSASGYARGKAIRGGVPICFPWFAGHATDAQAPAHGFARLVDWTLVDAADDGDDVQLAFRLSDSAETRSSAWPHRFQATYRVTVGNALSLSLDVMNTGDEEVAFEEALHTYYAVDDVRSVSVTGLEGAPYVDRLRPDQRLRQTPEPVRFEGETDRIYDTQAATVIEDPGSGRAVRTTTAGSASTVVWNPWDDKARTMADVGEGEWTGMCCVETGNVRDASVRLTPAESHTMTATITVTPLGRPREA